MSSTCGTGVGEAEGICMPGIIWCDGLGDGVGGGVGAGDAAGICIPGGISFRGLGDGEGAVVVGTLAGLRVVWRRGRVRRFGAAFGFGLDASGCLGITCPSCCGSAVALIANTRMRTPIPRNWIAKSDRIIFPPCVHRSGRRTIQTRFGIAVSNASWCPSHL